MKPKVYIDGKEGTTGLQIYERLALRDDIELLLIDEAKRKDADERKKLINAADITFLCLPDAAAKEAVSFVEKDSARIIDASTAHRTACLLYTSLWGRRLPRPLDIISGPEQADSLRRFRAHRCHREESQFWQCIPHIMQRTRTVIKY